MKLLVNVTCEEAKKHFLKGSSYFNRDFPSYFSFEPILQQVAEVLAGQSYSGFQKEKPDGHPEVNYSFVANKDGRLGWRPFELMHPAIYVSLVNSICEEASWEQITARLTAFEASCVICTSKPVISTDHQSDQATQIRHWWHALEQESIKLSLEYSHLLHTDVTDCYGSLYTHSISWALHGFEEAKKKKGKNNLLGNRIDAHIRAGRYAQTNGIPQGSVLMDFIAELVLGYVDELITLKLGPPDDFRILRYRDDYRVFTHNDFRAEEILKVISDQLRLVGMKLGVAKTLVSKNVVEGSIKPDKLAGIELQDLGDANAKTIQKRLLRLHSFGQKFPNSGALRRLASDLHKDIVKQTDAPEDLEVQIAIATDIAMVSPQAFPAIAGVLSHLISLADTKEKKNLWEKVYRKMGRVPYNGYLEIWLQRVTKSKEVGLDFQSKEPICKIVNRDAEQELWSNDWISSKCLREALSVSRMIVSEPSGVPEVVAPEEVELFANAAWMY